MQSKGLQHNEAAILAREIRKHFKNGLSYDFFSKGTVTVHKGKTFILKFSDYEAIVCYKTVKALPPARFYRSPPSISTNEYFFNARNIKTGRL